MGGGGVGQRRRGAPLQAAARERCPCPARAPILGVVAGRREHAATVGEAGRLQWNQARARL
eukprot:5957481-Alexandrium_andersonii.AAC.1